MVRTGDLSREQADGRPARVWAPGARRRALDCRRGQGPASSGKIEQMFAEAPRTSEEGGPRWRGLEREAQYYVEEGPLLADYGIDGGWPGLGSSNPLGLATALLSLCLVLHVDGVFGSGPCTWLCALPRVLSFFNFIGRALVFPGCQTCHCSRGPEQLACSVYRRSSECAPTNWPSRPYKPSVLVPPSH